MLAVRDTIIRQSDLSPYRNDIYALALISNIEHSITPDDLIQSFYVHSTVVNANKTAPDYLNGCDGEFAPLCIFIYELLKRRKHGVLFCNIA